MKFRGSRLWPCLLAILSGFSHAGLAAAPVTVRNEIESDLVALGDGIQLLTLRNYTELADAGGAVYLDDPTIFTFTPAELAFVNHFRDAPAELHLLFIPLLGRWMFLGLDTGALTGAQIRCPEGSGDRPRIVTAYADSLAHAADPHITQIGAALHLKVLTADVPANALRAHDQSVAATLVGSGTLYHPVGC